MMTTKPNAFLVIAYNQEYISSDIISGGTLAANVQRPSFHTGTIELIRALHVYGLVDVMTAVSLALICIEVSSLPL